jgi:hypothetical protein
VLRSVRLLVFGLAFGAASLSASASIDAKAPAVTVGRVSAESVKDPAIARELKSAVERELETLDLSKARASYVLSASLVTLETVTESERVESTAVVSAALAEKRGGSLRAVFRGKAQAIDGKDAARTAELAALKAAVRSALSRLPEAAK